MIPAGAVVLREFSDGDADALLTLIALPVGDRVLVTLWSDAAQVYPGLVLTREELLAAAAVVGG